MVGLVLKFKSSELSRCLEIRKFLNRNSVKYVGLELCGFWKRDYANYVSFRSSAGFVENLSQQCWFLKFCRVLESN